ncbi:hypothetical protein [Fodinicola feengrottensis]|uniref:Uncharacterized protein n=1 Tax=Fodinicola feengrottensis TaxID=435914 RepID=A0ABP4UDA4_9ACTN|nr:hypothetical protein [Fodinicola feengrottensis]
MAGHEVPWAVHMASLKEFAEQTSDEREMRYAGNNTLAAEIDQISRNFTEGCGIGYNLRHDPITAYIALTVSELFERVVAYMRVALEKSGTAQGLSAEEIEESNEFAMHYVAATRIAAGTFLHAACHHVGIDVPRPFGEPADLDALADLEFEPDVPAGE